MFEITLAEKSKPHHFIISIKRNKLTRIATTCSQYIYIFTILENDEHARYGYKLISQQSGMRKLILFNLHSYASHTWKWVFKIGVLNFPSPSEYTVSNSAIHTRKRGLVLRYTNDIPRRWMP